MLLTQKPDTLTDRFLWHLDGSFLSKNFEISGKAFKKGFSCVPQLPLTPMPDFQTSAFKFIQIDAGIHTVGINAPEAIPVTAVPSAALFRLWLRRKTYLLTLSPPAICPVQAALFGFGHAVLLLSHSIHTGTPCTSNCTPGCRCRRGRAVRPALCCSADSPRGGI